MKAVVLTRPCKAEEMRVTEIPVPKVVPGRVLIKVEAFGLNHSEVLLRQFEVAQPYIRKPIIPGIECVGVVADPSDTQFRKGQRVMALMGGMGRSFDGSYAEYCLVPADHVFAVDSQLGAEELAAVPETFYTAYGSLGVSLQLKAGDTLLIRGGTSTVGIAALQLAKVMGATVISTTRNQAKAELLRELGADDVITEGDDFRLRFLDRFPRGADKVLELIGASTLRDSLRVTAVHGIVCHTGLLGGVYGLKDFDPIKEIPSGVYLTGFYSNAPQPMQISEMMQLIDKGGIDPVIAARFTLDEISQAHMLAEKRNLTGKIVVKVSSQIP
ncbi:MAG: zinc-binding dehydrogenase [Duncaniella sp.]|nr:zinc-binding dehydrogenase [Duncaniella sp.]